jgi:hypothetical protein
VKRSTLAPDDLDRLFREIARRLPRAATIVLTGGSEAMLLGGARPTRDVDFGWSSADPSDEDGGAIEAAFLEAAAATGIAIEYSTDIDRWSSVSVPRSRVRSRPYRRVGLLRVRLLDPACWAVYKLARYWESDVSDLVQVLPRTRVGPLRLASLAGESLRASPRSPQLFLFRRQVEHFFREHGTSIWGNRFSAARAIARFHAAAGIPPASAGTGARRRQR